MQRFFQHANYSGQGTPIETVLDAEQVSQQGAPACPFAELGARSDAVFRPSQVGHFHDHLGRIPVDAREPKRRTRNGRHAAVAQHPPKMAPEAFGCTSCRSLGRFETGQLSNLNCIWRLIGPKSVALEADFA